MNKKVASILEYDKIMHMLSKKASSAITRERIEKLMPLKDINAIRHALEESQCAFVRITKGGAPSFSGLYDVSLFKKRLDIGASLDMSQLLMIGNLLEISERTKEYGRPKREDESADALTGYFHNIISLPRLKKKITRSILSENEMADDASAELSSIRKAKGRIDGRIHDKLTSMIGSASVRDCLQDTVIVQRNDRYCLSVRSEFKSRISGIVHDSSATGSTLFIEPMAVIEISNELKTLERRESEEIDRILAALSSEAAENIDILISNYNILKDLDFIFAKGALAADMNASVPTYNSKGIINLRKARHPLLDRDKVVPIDIRLGEEYDQLVVTGPNTGGKTVSLKTLGLFAMMGQAGLLIPANDRSTLPVFTSIYADIGDEQSIEQSLSTFSSHMTNITHILRGAKKNPKRTLVLFDELCAGTDPSEGAALATAILDLLRQSGTLSVATTHYSELKVYALSTDGVENASCEFDVESLSPTYRLLIGVPGKSNAFAISKKLGLDPSIIEDARSRLSEESASFENLIVDLEEKRHALEADMEKIARQKEKISAEREKISRQRQKLEDQRADIIAKANEKASNILKDAKDSADAAIRNINKYGSADGDISKMEASRANLGKKLSHTRNASRAKPAKDRLAAKSVDPAKLGIGDAVHVNSLGLDGTVHSLPNAKGDLVVTMGIMQSKVNISDLTEIPEENKYAPPTKKQHRAGSGNSFGKAMSVSAEIKLIGMTVDEALRSLDKYLDDARLSHLDSVRVVHGKGTGALRNAIHDYLRRQPVSGYHLAEYGEGDSGVTIVEL